MTGLKKKVLYYTMEHYSVMKKEWSTDTFYKMGESWTCAEWKKPDTKGHILHDSISRKYPE